MVMTEILTRFSANLEFAVVVIEKYKFPKTDATHHFHALLSCKTGKRFETQSASYFDPVFDYHCNIKTVSVNKRGKLAPGQKKPRELWRALEYILKEDETPLVWPTGFNPRALSKQLELQSMGRRMQLAIHVQQNSSKVDCLTTIPDQYQDLVMYGMRNLEQYQTMCKLRELRTRIVKVTIDLKRPFFHCLVNPCLSSLVASVALRMHLWKPTK